MKNYYTYKQLQDDLGFTPTQIEEAQKGSDPEIIHLGRDVYVRSVYLDLERIHENMYPDATYLFPDSIHYLQSALYFQGLSDHVPSKHLLAVGEDREDFSNKRSTYGFTKLEGLQLMLGAETTFYYGEPVITYNEEKTLCDLLANQDKVLVEDINIAFTRYCSKAPAYDVLDIYATTLGVKTELKNKLAELGYKSWYAGSEIDIWKKSKN